MPMVLQHVSPHSAAVLTGKEFFPQLTAGPFQHGLVVVFAAATVMSLVAALASLVRGGTGSHGEASDVVPAEPAEERAPAG